MQQVPHYPYCQKFPVHPALVVQIEEFPHCTKFPALHFFLQLVVSEILFFLVWLHPVLDSETLQILILVTIETDLQIQGNHKLNLKEFLYWGVE